MRDRKSPSWRHGSDRLHQKTRFHFCFGCGVKRRKLNDPKLGAVIKRRYADRNRRRIVLEREAERVGIRHPKICGLQTVRPCLERQASNSTTALLLVSNPVTTRRMSEAAADATE